LEEKALPRTDVKLAARVLHRAKKIRVLLMDADGTLTDGRVWLVSQPDGTATEMKCFDAQDGAGLTLAATAGIRTGVITGRESPAMRRRAKEARIEFVYEACPVKIPAYEEILQKAGVSDEEVAYVGDDLPDLPVMERVGLAVAVANAVPEVKRAAHYVTRREGGRGGIRETVELILKAQGLWEKMISKARA
jgi:3-deoxy-D-manno-octulosonate 8-phosphate phosphatase (KDO 8-P phosphatase)